MPKSNFHLYDQSAWEIFKRHLNEEKCFPFFFVISFFPDFPLSSIFFLLSSLEVIVNLAIFP